jgi:anti-sigma-K factor RskA
MSERYDNLAELADNYVLGLLDADEQADVEARIEQDGELRRAVAESRDRFVELDLTAQPAVPSAELWSKIATGIDAARIEAAPESPERKMVTPLPANQNTRSLWRTLALAATAASIVLAVALGRTVAHAPEPKVIAVLLDQGGQPLALVEDFGDASAKVVQLTNFDVPAGKVMQVWTLPSKDMGPVSLGLLTGAGSSVLSGPALPQPKDGQLYEITLEPKDGSPTGRPTGAILVKGYARQVSL